ncbi:MAG: hypothetical protein E7483_00640 [Ruminococcaceae bacterium]|nr:hypothetical protein [Oscillospiraceae bacterium]
MFGYVQANTDILTQEEKSRYREFYCGLCHTLGNRYGFTSRLSLSFDMTFLAILLSSLYEPAETQSTSRCIMHPFKEHRFITNPYIDYAADMTVALVYFNCIDDWKDDKNFVAKGYASLLSNAYKKVKIDWPLQCEAIEKELNILAKIEAENNPSLDAAANSFGRLMEALFVYKNDIWADYLKKLGYGLGRYIYLADASVDLEKDIKKGSYNPLINQVSDISDFKPRLQLLLGEASQCFEKLPLVQDENILKNIIYSGIWNKYNQKINKGEHRNDK